MISIFYFTLLVSTRVIFKGLASRGWELTDGTWFEDNRKIVFFNIPPKSVIKIYTLAGDLVKTLGHNIDARTSEKYM